MDIIDLRVFFTVFSMLVFLAIVAWTYSRRNRHAFDAIAALPLLDDEFGAGDEGTNAGRSA
jgi:cbb3-type cytochrome oxidase subunit 3